jgi:hypothetical protein
MAETDTRLANRILLGLVLGAIAGALVLAIGSRVPALLEGAHWDRCSCGCCSSS